ncbi:hypothetical protein Gobs01_01693 [Geodermatophilus obscurus DSM 43160]
MRHDLGENDRLFYCRHCDSGALLWIIDADGLRVTAFATNSSRGQLPALELRHRRRARVEDRIQAAKDTGLTNLPLHDFAQNQICASSSRWPASSPPGCRCLLPPTHPPTHPAVGTQTAATELLTVPTTLAGTGRRRLLHLADHHYWAVVVYDAVVQLRALTTGPMLAPG